MKRNSLLIAFTMVLVLVGSALAATSKHSSRATGELRISGTVVSSSNSELVLSSRIKGKAEQETFVVNPQTKTEGTLTKGERVMVHYKSENGKKIATIISAHKMMAAKNK
jgi:type 1 fimbria pilin